ncbi:MAG: penicillin acylase family protein [Acidobacteria bacterium]|nr:penicillin acylase family protein [Acidobacteriota bacterium]
MKFPVLLLLLPFAFLNAEDVAVRGLEKPVEILRDKWGVPHIYAQTARDLFFAQGFITARDRLFQLDLWRRQNSGHLAEAVGAEALGRDRIARLVRYRGDWATEWAAYSPDARDIATAFTGGINAYIDWLNGKWPAEFRAAGFGPGKWQPEDVAARVAGLLMTRNLTREVQRAQDITRFGLDAVRKYLPVDAPGKIEIPRGLDLNGITTALLADYNAAIGSIRLKPAGGVQLVAAQLERPGNMQGSNNWVVSGARSETGKPLLASDPHRPINLPSLRKTVHLVGPGWNVIGAGEPALPGIALGHNEDIGFGFTIVGIDQVDLYVEKTNPANPEEYLHKGAWRKMEVLHEEIAVRGEAKPRRVALRYTLHGPVIAEDLGRQRVHALKWVGAEPGGAGYLGALRLSRARNWTEFEQAAAMYKVPSENLVYADRAGNIGWIASGQAPLRKGWNGLLPVPGDTGEYEWSGYLPGSENPRSFNPASGAIGTANHNILPAGYPHMLGYEFAPPFRFDRVNEMLQAQPWFTLSRFGEMQHDALSHPARLFQQIVRQWQPAQGELNALESSVLSRFKSWDAVLAASSSDALVYELWTGKLHAFLFGPRLGSRVDLGTVLATLGDKPDWRAVRKAFQAAVRELERDFGTDPTRWQWGKVHTVRFTHPLDDKRLHRGPFPRSGDGNTVLATGGASFRQNIGASYRQILDLADWDRSVATNVPGESGDPASPFYDNLLPYWLSGRYHPLPYTRTAVEAATVERTRLTPTN